MSQLSRFVRKNKAKLRKAAITGLRVIAAGVTKGKSEKVIQNLKGIGAAVKTYKGLTKRPSKSEAAAQAKVEAVQPPKIVPISAVTAQSMPGGAKLRGVANTSGSTARRTRGAVVKTTKRAAAKPKKGASGSKRKAPTGGLDLKALSASWKKAGKPGKWIDWVKKNR